MSAQARLLICLFLLGSLAASCVGGGQPTEGPQPMPTEAYVSQEAIKETTVAHLADDWQIGLQMVYQGQYTDADGAAAHGPVARISVWNGQQPQATTLEVHPGSLIDAGKQYRVIRVEAGPNSGKPGSATGYIVIGQLP